MNTELTLVENELADNRVTWTPLGITMPEDLPVEGWVKIGVKLKRAGVFLDWCKGDWAAFGNRKYKELQEFCSLHEIDIAGMQRLAEVAEAIEPGRRRDNLSFAFHEAVVGFSPKKQEDWLDRAEKDRLTCSALRKQIRLAGGEESALDRDGPRMKSAAAACFELVRFLKSQPAEFWTDDVRLAWRESLRPIVEHWTNILI